MTVNFISRSTLQHLTGIEVVFKVREKGVTLDLPVYSCKQKLRASWQECGVELRAPDQVESAPIRGFFDGLK